MRPPPAISTTSSTGFQGQSARWGNIQKMNVVRALDSLHSSGYSPNVARAKGASEAKCNLCYSLATKFHLLKFLWPYQNRGHRP